MRYTDAYVTGQSGGAFLKLYEISILKIRNRQDFKCEHFCSCLTSWGLDHRFIVKSRLIRQYIPTWNDISFTWMINLPVVLGLVNIQYFYTRYSVSLCRQNKLTARSASFIIANIMTHVGRKFDCHPDWRYSFHARSQGCMTSNEKTGVHSCFTHAYSLVFTFVLTLSILDQIKSHFK